MGKRLGALWKTLHPGFDPLPLVDSSEDSGTFRVTEYPDHFTPMIDQLIRNYHQEILQQSRERKAQSAIQTIPKTVIPESPPSPEIKIRKRIPVKQIPAWKSK